MRNTLKIDYVSDLHMEINSNSEQLTTPVDDKGDILLLVGDIATYRHFGPKKTDPESRSIQRRFAKFIQAQPHAEILWIPGNHEYYGFYFEGADKWMDGIARSLDPRLRIFQNELVIRNGVAIFGSTFWMNMNNYNPLTMMAVGNGMTDFEIIQWKRDEDVTYEDRHRFSKFTNRFGTETAYREHCVALANLKQYYDMFSSMPFVVATHHGCSMQSHNPHRFGDNELKWGWISEYGDWIADSKIDHWIHGHTHHNVDYKLGNCHVQSAMYGYVGYDRPWNERKMKMGRIEI